MRLVSERGFRGSALVHSRTDGELIGVAFVAFLCSRYERDREEGEQGEATRSPPIDDDGQLAGRTWGTEKGTKLDRARGLRT